MRVVLALAAALALPIHAAAHAPAPTQAPSPTPAPSPAQAPSPAPTDPAASGTPTEQTSAPGDTAPADAPKVDPAYGERPAPSHDTRNFPAPRGKDVVIVSYPDRSKRNITTLAVLGGGGLLASALGLYFHLDSRSASDDVSAQSYTGETWSAAHEDTYDRAHRSSIAAGVLYGLGAGLVLATAITYIVTEPKPETMVIHPHSTHASARARRVPLVAPTRGGAVVGGAWSF